ncbi:MAG: hypothetical protein AAF745_15270 [Planctomycetota bacterium]
MKSTAEHWTIDDQPNPFVILHDGPTSGQRLIRAAKYLTLIVVCASLAFGGIHIARQWSLTHLQRGMADLSPSDQQDRLVQLASFGNQSIEPLVRQLDSEHDDVAHTAFALLHEKQDVWAGWPTNENANAHRQLVEAITSLLDDRQRDAETNAPLTESNAARIRDLLRRTLAQFAAAVDADDDASVWTQARLALASLYQLRIDPAVRIVSSEGKSLSKQIDFVANTNDAWTDWPPVDRPRIDSRELDDSTLPADSQLLPIAEGQALALGSVNEPTDLVSEVTDQNSPSTSVVLVRRPTAQLVRTSATFPGSMMRALITESVMRHLSHSERTTVQDAEIELTRRGISESTIELARQMTNGTPTDRMQLIDHVIRGSEHDPRFWLRFNIDDPQRRVRLHVVSILATMSTADSRDILRHRLPDESDPEVATRIRRALSLR